MDWLKIKHTDLVRPTDTFLYRSNRKQKYIQSKILLRSATDAAVFDSYKRNNNKMFLVYWHIYNLCIVVCNVKFAFKLNKKDR